MDEQRETDRLETLSAELERDSRRYPAVLEEPV